MKEIIVTATRRAINHAAQEALRTLQEAFRQEVDKQAENIKREGVGCFALNRTVPLPNNTEAEVAAGNGQFAAKGTIGRAEDSSVFFGVGAGTGAGASATVNVIATGRTTAQQFAGVSLDVDGDFGFCTLPNGSKTIGGASGLGSGIGGSVSPFGAGDTTENLAGDVSVAGAGSFIAYILDIFWSDKGI